MEEHVRAGIELFERSLRYAEVEDVGQRSRLLRLGSCDFDFDVARQMLTDEHPIYLDTVAEAMGDVFSGSSASSLQIAVHPPSCFSFFAPFPSGMSADKLERRVELELEQVIGNELQEPARFSAFHISSDVLSDGLNVEWYHIAAFREEIYERVSRILKALPVTDYHLKTSMEGAASVLTRAYGKLAQSKQELPKYALTIGWYPSHVEYVLIREGQWYYSQYADVQSPQDTTYFALTLINRLQIDRSEIEQLFVYGTGFSLADPRLLSKTFGLEVVHLDPLQVVTMDVAHLSSSFEADAYVPCIGIALS